MERRLDDRFINIFPMPHSAPLRFPLTETVCKEIATAGRSKLIDNFYQKIAAVASGKCFQPVGGGAENPRGGGSCTDEKMPLANAQQSCSRNQQTKPQQQQKQQQQQQKMKNETNSKPIEWSGELSAFLN